MEHGAPTAVLLAPAYDHDEYRSAESLGLRAIAAALVRAGAEVHVVDECPPAPDTRLLRRVEAATLVGLGALFTRQVPDALSLARGVRTLTRAHITMGGQGVSFLWRRILADCAALDSVCLYEADETIVELWNVVRAGGVPADIAGLCSRRDDPGRPPRPRPPVLDLDRLPFPFRRAGSGAYRDGHATIHTSRGCAAHCSFCQSGNYGNRYHGLALWRARSPERVVDEIVELRERHGVRAVSVVDDDFLGGDGRGVRRARAFAAALRLRAPDVRFSIECRIDEIEPEIMTELRDAGLRHVLVGVESANATDSRLFAKKTSNAQAVAAIELLRELGIETSIGFIMFHPLSNPVDLRTNIVFLRDHGICAYRRIANRLELYPGAPLLSYFRRRGVVFREDDYRLYYDFADKRVKLFYSLVRRVLAPFAALERQRARAAFAVANAADNADQACAKELGRIAADISTSEANFALDLLDAVVGGRAEADEAATDKIRTYLAETSDRLHRCVTTVITG